MVKKTTATAKPNKVSKGVAKAAPVAAPKNNDKDSPSKLLDKEVDGSRIIRSSVVASRGFVTFKTAIGSGYRLSEAEYRAL